MKKIYVVGLLLSLLSMPLCADKYSNVLEALRDEGTIKEGKEDKDLRQLTKKTKIWNLSDKTIRVWGIPYEGIPRGIGTLAAGGSPISLAWSSPIRRFWAFDQSLEPNVQKIRTEITTVLSDRVRGFDKSQKAVIDRAVQMMFDKDLQGLEQKSPGRVASATAFDIPWARNYTTSGTIYSDKDRRVPSDLQLFITPDMQFRANIKEVLSDIAKKYRISKKVKDEVTVYYPKLDAYQKELAGLLQRVKGGMVDKFGYDQRKSVEGFVQEAIDKAKTLPRDLNAAIEQRKKARENPTEKQRQAQAAASGFGGGGYAKRK